MIVYNSYPDKEFTILLQINFIGGDVGFFKYIGDKDLFDYGNKIVALFKCKLKQK